MLDITKFALVTLTAIAAVACKNQDTRLESTPHPKDDVTKTTQCGQLYAQVKARPNDEKTGYDVVVRNFGSSPISCWGTITQQWREWEGPRSIKQGWNQESPADHHDPIYRIDPEEEVFLYVPRHDLVSLDGYVRFGVHFQCVSGEEFQKLTVWSQARPVRQEFRPE